MDIRNIWAIGRNYSDHAKEMSAEVPKEPLIFLKAGSGAFPNGTSFSLPSFSQDIHHELEIAFRIDDQFKLSQITLALDLTARDLQAQAKKSGTPWTLAKSFSQSTALGDWLPCQNPDEDFNFELKVNGNTRQKGKASEMIFKPRQVLEYLRARFPVVPGDLLLTGTPAGVGRVQSGDRLEAFLNGRIQGSWLAR